ncbi:MAG: amphi-Trp domain-containing protein [Haloarculaceae archaeon]
MPEEQRFKTEAKHSRSEIAEILADAAAQLDTGTVHLSASGTDETVEIPDRPILEQELEVLTDSETGEKRYELEYEIRWSK